MGSIRVFIIDDHPIFREAFRSWLAREPDLEYAGESDGTGDVYSLVHAMRPQVVVVDYRLPDAVGDVLTHELKTEDTELRVLGISSDTGARDRMMAAGADAFLEKSEMRSAASAIRELVHA